MDVLSFTTIILLLFIIYGSYLIFTNQLEGKPKIILIIALIICVIYIFINLFIIKSTPSTVDASTITYVPTLDTSIQLIGKTASLIDTTSPIFSLSMWIYITDWNPGVTKTVFSMTNTISEYSPKIILGPQKNELIITYYTKPTTSDNSNWNKQYNIETALKRYQDAKKAYILASNEENTTNNVGQSSSLSAITAKALTELIESRTAYDGGSTGLYANGTDLELNKYQTLYSPSSLINGRFSSAYIGELGSNNNSNYSPISLNISGISNETKLYSDINEANVRFPNNYQFLTVNTLYNYNDYVNIAAGVIYNNDNSEINYIKNIINNYPKYKNSALYNYVNRDIPHPQVTNNAGSLVEDYSLETITIPQIRIQKWIHIVISFGVNSVDTYLDGKLVDSHISTGSIQHVTTIANDTTLNWGGFTGNISAYEYNPTFLSPQEVMKKFEKGV
jgi:hypothetical protein